MAQRYDANDVAVDDAFVVNTTTNHAQRNAKVIELNDGFYVVWGSSQFGSSFHVGVQKFGFDGAPIGDEVMLQTTAWIGDNLSTNFTLNPVGSKAFEITLGTTSFSEGGNVKLLGDLGSAPEIMETSWGQEGIVIKSDHDLSKPVATFSARDVDGDQLSVTMSENIFEVVSRENDAGTPAVAGDDFFEFDLFVKKSGDGGPVLSSMGWSIQLVTLVSTTPLGLISQGLCNLKLL